MKYVDFYKLLMTLPLSECHIYPGISLISSNGSLKIKLDGELPLTKQKRFVIFPIKIYGQTAKHLNVIVLDNRTKILTRFEPFHDYFKTNIINKVLEPFMYKLMEQKYIYFLKYQIEHLSDPTLSRNCGYYCIQYLKTLISQSKKSGFERE